jgi:F-type H+-transporting ATPase subunit a
VSVYEPLHEWLGIPPVFQATFVATVCLLGAVWLTRRQLAAVQNAALPDEGVTLRNVFELLVEALDTLAKDIMGPDRRRYLPLVGTIFVFILTANLLGLIPGFSAATGDMNVTYAWALISFCAYNYVGIRKHGFWYVNQFLGPSFLELKLLGRHVHVRLLAPFFLVIETILHFARILTLAVRLAANMFADHAVVGTFLAILPIPILIPAIFMGLGVLVAFIQAFVFALLTMIYIGLALQEAH